jgi:hypothetical protein
MQTVEVRFQPSPSSGVAGYTLAIATSSGSYGSATQVTMPMSSARNEGGGVLAYDVQMRADRRHYLAMRAYSGSTFSPYSNEIVIPAVASSATSSTSLAMTAATGETIDSMSGIASSGSGTSGATGSGSTSGAASDGDGTDAASDEGSGTASAGTGAMSSLDFDGAGEYLASSADYPLGASNQFTLSLWAAADPSATGPRALISVRGGSDTAQNRVELSANGADLQMTFSNAAGELVFTATYAGALVPGEWQHLALSFDAQVDSAPSLLVDGLTRAPTSANLTGHPAVLTDSAGRVFVGGSASGTTGTWFGAIGHIALFGAALGDDEIHEISVRGHTLDLHENAGAYQSSDALLHYWRLGDDPSFVGYDSGTADVAVDLDDPTGSIDVADVVADAPVLLP